MEVLEYEEPFSLTLITEDGDAAFSTDQAAGPPPASVVAVDDPFYLATSDDPDSFEHEKDSTGTLHAAAVVGHQGRATWTLVFSFDDGSTITAIASLPVGDRGRPGAGGGSVVNGTGRFGGLRGDLDVRVKNPHRWSITR